MINHINKNKNALCVLLSFILCFSLIPIFLFVNTESADAKQNINIGDYVQLGTYGGQNILWRCVDIDENGPLMLSDTVIDSFAYDAKTSDNSKTLSHGRNSFRAKYGSNHWRDSNLRSWLNTSANAGEVTWLCGNAPKSGYVSPSSEYDSKSGFLNGFSTQERFAIKATTQRSIISHPEYTAGYAVSPGSDLNFSSYISDCADGFDKAYYENITDLVFALDVKQLNKVYQNRSILGDDYYIGRNASGSSWGYWLRTPVTTCNHLMRYCDSRGSIYKDNPYVGYIGIRPAFYLDVDFYKTTSGTGSKTSPYIGSAPDKTADDKEISGAEETSGSGQWDVDTSMSLELTLGDWYSSDGEYANPIIRVQVIQKPRSDEENMVFLIMAEGYKRDQMQKFIADTKRMWEFTISREPYKSLADRINVYALCTESKSGFGGGNTFFDVSYASQGRDLTISNYKSDCKNKIPIRCIGPEFIDKIHDAHIPNTTDPNKMAYNADGSRNEYAPYYYVTNYIDEFGILCNTAGYGGSSESNIPYNLHDFIAPADNEYSEPTFLHELGHAALDLTEEYSKGTLPEELDTQPNVAWTGDPTKVKWKDMLGFRDVFSTRNEYNESIPDAQVNSTWNCVMRNNQSINYHCEVCKLTGARLLSKKIKNPPSLYVATPEAKIYSGKYRSVAENPDAFSDSSFSAFWTYDTERRGMLLSGIYKSQFKPSLAGSEVEVRTIVQNLKKDVDQQVTLKMYIKHADGSVAVTQSGNRVESQESYTVPMWDEQSWASGIKNCSLIYKIPSDALLQDGDTLAFQLLDEDGNVLADDNSETNPQPTVTINYVLEDGTPVPSTYSSKIPVAYGTRLNLQAPQKIGDYVLVKMEGAEKIITSDSVVSYIYKDDSDTPVPDPTPPTPDPDPEPATSTIKVQYGGHSAAQGATSITLNGAQVDDGTKVKAGDVLNFTTKHVEWGGNVVLVKSAKINNDQIFSSDNIYKGAWRSSPDSSVIWSNIVNSVDTFSYAIPENSSDEVVIDVQFQELSPIWRLFNPTTKEHVFTSSRAEYDFNVNGGFGVYYNGEGIDWFAPASSDTGIVRLFNAAYARRGLCAHYYCTKREAEEVRRAFPGEWEYDFNGSPVFYSGGDIPVYTAFKASENMSHHYTTDRFEYDTLASWGWDLEPQKSFVNGVATGIFRAALRGM